MNCTTINQCKKTSILQAILQGLDKNLDFFIPTDFYQFTEDDYQKMQGMVFAERLAYILQFFFGEEIEFESLKVDCERAMQKFAADDPMPLVKLEKNLFLAELFYGESHVVYDFANALFPYIYAHAYAKYGNAKKPLFVAACDINSAISLSTALHSIQNAKTVILYPDAFCSKLQKIELAQQKRENLHILPIKSADLEDVEKVILQFLQEEQEHLEDMGYLVTVVGEWNILNSIVQTAIFVSSYIDILAAKEVNKAQKIDIVFAMEHCSNLAAFCYAKAMGLPVQNAIVGLNVNSSFYKAVQTGKLQWKDTTLTIAPAMDSNLPYTLLRILAYFDSASIQTQKNAFMQKNDILLTDRQREGLQKNIFFVSAKEEDQIDSIYHFFEEYDYLLDTHTACGVYAYTALVENREIATNKRIVFANVNPFQYPQDSMYAITGEDIKDSFKAIKHLELATAMQAPKSIKKLRTMQADIATFSIDASKKYLQNLCK